LTELFGRTLAQDWLLTPFIMIAITIILQNKQVTQILFKADENTAKGPSSPCKKN